MQETNKINPYLGNEILKEQILRGTRKFIAENLMESYKKKIHVTIHRYLEIKRLKWRGFNQSEEIGKELAKFLKIPLTNDVLYKTRETPPQMELVAEARKENIREAFLVKNKEKITAKKILLIDDVYTTGSTMNECARVLKDSGAKEVWGVAVARE